MSKDYKKEMETYRAIAHQNAVRAGKLQMYIHELERELKAVDKALFRGYPDIYPPINILPSE